MKIATWHPEMSDKETADLAYWERNMLALHYADGWYNDDVPDPKYGYDPVGCEECAEEGQHTLPRYQHYRRVLSLEGGTITFHVPDDFDVGALPQIDEPNWDGHTTEEKWLRIAKRAGCQP